MFDNGDFVVTWTEEFSDTDLDVRMRGFRRDGTAFTGDFGVSTLSSNQSDVSIDVRFVVAYEDDTNESVRYLEYDSFGNPIGFSQQYDVSQGFEDNPAIALNGNGSQMIIVADDDLFNSFDPTARVFKSTNQNNLIIGGSNNDIISGQAGNDFFDGRGGNDTINGGLGNDIMSGGADNDILVGASGNDTINGETGSDTVNYSSLGRAVTLLRAGSVSKGTLGTDTLQNVERIIGAVGFNNAIDASSGSTASINANLATNSLTINLPAFVGSPLTFAVENFVNVSGSQLSDIIIGNAANNLLSGQSGNDIINGGLGNDIMSGGAGNDIMSGSTGNDTMSGGLGDDILYIDSVADLASEGLNAGIDTVVSTVSHTLGANVEKLTLGGSIAINGVGNSFNNVLIGNAANNILNGSVGNDTLIGGAGNDILTGGLGNDSLTGGFGADRFAFNSRSEGIDRITDFVAVDDTISVSAAGFGGGLIAGRVITADQFAIGTRALESVDRFIYNRTSGALFFDSDGLGATAQVQIATLSNLASLTSADILVLA